MNISFLPISFWFELLSLLTGIFLIRKFAGSVYFYLIIVLFITVAIEFYGAVLKSNSIGNSWLYNILTLIQFPYWIFLFRYHLQGRMIKMVSAVFIILFLVYGAVNLFFIQGLYFFNNYTLIAGALLVVFLCILYLKQLLKVIEEVSLLKTPMFWITCGALFFFIGTFFYFSLYSYLVKTRKAASVFNLIILNLNIIFYSCISIALIVFKREK